MIIFYHLYCLNSLCIFSNSSRKRQGPMAEKYCYHKMFPNFFWTRRLRQEKDIRMVKLDSFFLKLSFSDIYILKSNIHFLVHGHCS